MWTTDEYWPPEAPEVPEAPAQAQPQGPTPLQCAQIVLRAIRPFPEAYRAMLAALEALWPIPILNTA